jgi:hypothetical protein
MDEHAEIKTHHEALVATIGEAQVLVRGAVEEFLANLAQAETLCEKAKNIAQVWNREAETLALPEDFLVSGYSLLNDIKRSVTHLDIFSRSGLLTRKPLSSDDLAPRYRQTRA